MEGSGSGAVSEKGWTEVEDREAIAAGDDNDVAMDRGSAKNGDMSRDQPALPPEKVNLYQYSGLTRMARLRIRAKCHNSRTLFVL